MEKIRFLDTTLRDGEQSPGCSMSASEKLTLAKQLERLGVNTIEAGFAASSPGDFNSVRDIGEQKKQLTMWNSVLKTQPEVILNIWWKSCQRRYVLEQLF